MDAWRQTYANVIAQIESLSTALDERDEGTREHCDRVSALAVELGMQCGLSERELAALRLAAGFHDIGKIGIPDGILKKRQKLTPDDWRTMETHPLRSERIMLAADLQDGALVAQAVRHHHERVDGAGYPDALAGEAIPILSRIVAVVDAYDAMARLRHYGPVLSHRQIMEELRRHAGRQHDAFLVGKFADLIEASPFKTSEI